MREIALRHEGSSVSPKNSRGMKLALRGLYYLSPFVRDFQNCQELRDMFCKVVGEPLIPHPGLSNVPQVMRRMKRNVFMWMLKVFIHHC